MPFPIIAAAAAAAPLVASGVNALSQGSMNAKTRDHQYSMWNQQNTLDAANWDKQNAYNEKMWGQQKDYNEGLWNKQNEYQQQLWHQQNAYDSPAMQMARFKEAGLNPNLIYGQQSSSGSIQSGNLENAKFQASGQPQSHAPQQWQPKAPNFDIGQGLLAYNQFRQSGAQTNNLEATNKAIEAGVALTMANTQNVLATTSKTLQDTEYGKQAFGRNLDLLGKNIEKITQEIGMSGAKFGLDLEEQKQRTMGITQDNLNKALTNKQQQYIQQMREKGFELSDPWYIRLLDDERLDKMMENLGKVGKGAIKSLF